MVINYKLIDFFLTDGQMIISGNPGVRIVYSPGHNLSRDFFITPTKNGGSHYTAYITGGAGLLWSS
jgi:hypothetical protein